MLPQTPLEILFNTRHAKYYLCKIREVLNSEHIWPQEFRTRDCEILETKLSNQQIKYEETSKICEDVSSCCRTLLHFEDEWTRYLQSHSFTIWWGLDKIPAVVLCYNLRTTRQDTCSRTLLQYDEDSTRYLQLHSTIIWGRLDKIPAVALCYNLRTTQQDTCSRTLLQYDEDSTRYLQSHSAIIWGGLDKILAVALL